MCGGGGANEQNWRAVHQGSEVVCSYYDDGTVYADVLQDDSHPRTMWPIGA